MHDFSLHKMYNICKLKKKWRSLPVYEQLGQSPQVVHDTPMMVISADIGKGYPYIHWSLIPL